MSLLIRRLKECLPLSRDIEANLFVNVDVITPTVVSNTILSSGTGC